MREVYLTLIYREHAIQRMFERDILEENVEDTIKNGEIIEEYIDDKKKNGVMITRKG